MENQTNTNEEPTLIQELIKRYNQRLKVLWSNPNPFTKPLWEASEINQKIKQLEAITKNK